MNLGEFEEIVREAVESLPGEFTRQLDNVAVTVEEWPSENDLAQIRLEHGRTLFGLYRGVPKTKRGAGYSMVAPDKITIFAGPILAVFQNKTDARKQIFRTVLHEIGHHFGMTEEEIRLAQGPKRGK